MHGNTKSRNNRLTEWVHGPDFIPSRGWCWLQGTAEAVTSYSKLLLYLGVKCQDLPSPFTVISLTERWPSTLFLRISPLLPLEAAVTPLPTDKAICSFLPRQSISPAIRSVPLSIIFHKEWDEFFFSLSRLTPCSVFIDHFWWARRDRYSLWYMSQRVKLLHAGYISE